ncbi:MAG: ferrochelatase [Parachlamydiaceae bacterium]|nr:ferrochelatase [Parachlamydiaceae bacterium]
MSKQIGVLLVNLGTPRSPKNKDVFRYLIEFLTDARVIDLPWWKRQLLVRGLIVPSRYRQSAKAYQAIWTKEGSPLLVYGQKVEAALQEALGENFCVKLAMRYQEPSIPDGIKALMEQNVEQLIVLPLFPQYASATTGSVHQRVLEELRSFEVIPKLTLINQYATDPDMIKAFSAIAKEYVAQDFDHLLFSFHGLPERHIRKADRHGCCLQKSTCCEEQTPINRDCYKAQCHATANAIAQSLKIAPERYSICFQSRLGKDPWLQPYASDTIHQLAKQGKKHVLVMSPSFVCDCLETTFEIGVEYAHEFKNLGGEKLQLIPGLNEHPLWISALKGLVTKNLVHVHGRIVGF